MNSRDRRRSRKMQKASADSKERFAGFGLAVFTRVQKQRNAGKGPMKWCNQCHRRHRSRDTCNLFLRTRTAKSGKKMKVWAH